VTDLHEEHREKVRAEAVAAKERERNLLARIAGNVASGLLSADAADGRLSSASAPIPRMVAADAVAIARAILAEVDRD
jgi:hypothetical protein